MLKRWDPVDSSAGLGNVTGHLHQQMDHMEDGTLFKIPLPIVFSLSHLLAGQRLFPLTLILTSPTREPLYLVELKGQVYGKEIHKTKEFKEIVPSVLGNSALRAVVWSIWDISTFRGWGLTVSEVISTTVFYSFSAYRILHMFQIEATRLPSR